MIETIEAAINDARDILKVLEAQIRARGYSEPSAALEVRATGGVMISLRCGKAGCHAGFVTSWGAHFGWDFLEGATFTEALGKAHDTIWAMDEHPSKVLAETWFNPHASMNRPEGDSPSATSGQLGDTAPPQANAVSPSSSAAAMSAEVGGDGAAAVLTSGAVAADAYSEESNDA